MAIYRIKEMRNLFLPLALACLVLCLAPACATSGQSGVKADDPSLINPKTVHFTAESIEGHVQIRPHRNAVWHDLKPGEVFDGFAQIRTGVHSKATLKVKNGKHGLRCDVGALVCQTNMVDVYRKVLCPTALEEYNRKHWEKEEYIDPKALVLVDRDALNGFPDEGGLLAEASNVLSLRNQQQQGGAAGAAAGGAPGGGGTGGGGCGPGG